MRRTLLFAATLALAAHAQTVDAQAPAPVAPDPAAVLEPLVAAAERTLEEDPVLALARAELTRASVPPTSWIHERAGSVVFQARARIVDPHPPERSADEVLEPLVAAVARGRTSPYASARLEFVAARMSPHGPLARRVRALAAALALHAPPVVRPRDDDRLPAPPLTSRSVPLAAPVVSEPAAGPLLDHRDRARLCGWGDRRQRLECHVQVLEGTLLEVDADLALQTRPDDTIPAILLGVGIPVAAAGAAMTIYTALAQVGTWTAIPIVFLGLGAISTVVGIVWLAQNGAPWRRRDRLQQQLDQRRRALELTADVTVEGARLGLTVTF